MNHATFFKTAGLGLCLAISAAGVSAQTNAAPKMDHSAHGAPTVATTNEATKAYLQSDEKMMKGMNEPYTGDADKDYVAKMIAHHQGAVDMSQVLLKYGKDPELRKMAQNVIKAQEEEIAFMKKWQAKNGVK